MALWDALSRLRRGPLLALLGGMARPLPAYAGVGYDGEVRSPKVAEQWVWRGFKGVKAKIGYPTTAKDMEVIRAIRNAVGPDVAAEPRVRVQWSNNASHVGPPQRDRLSSVGEQD